MVSQSGWVSRQGISGRFKQGWVQVRQALRRWTLLLNKKHPIHKTQRDEEIHPIYRTQKDVEIAIRKGSKSPNDFVVVYREPGKDWRTPKHIHLIVELYVKEAYDKVLTHQLRDHLLKVFRNVQPIDYYPPKIQFFEPDHVLPFQSLDAVGEMSVEFLLVVSELIFIQEKTNYPGGSLTYKLYEEFGVKDRFTVINDATLEKQKR